MLGIRPRHLRDLPPSATARSLLASCPGYGKQYHELRDSLERLPKPFRRWVRGDLSCLTKEPRGEC